MIGLLVFVVICLYVFKYYYDEAYKRPENYPPGPPKLPVYGGYLIMMMKAFRDLALATSILAKEYNTKVVGIFLGNVPQVLVNDPELIKEVLLREDFDGRMDSIVGRARCVWKKLGVFFTEGYFWQVQRRFSLRHMRDFGFGRRSEQLEDVMALEMKEMFEIAQSGPKTDAEKEIIKGDLVCVPHIFDVPFLNGMLYVFTKSTIPREKYPILWNIAKESFRFQRSSNDLGGLIAMTPWLKNIAPKLTGFTDLVESTNVLKDFYTVIIEDAIATFDPSCERHFLDTYIKKMKEELKEKGTSTYSVEQLVMICTDYTFPSTTGTTATLTFIIERLLIQGEIQDKIHEELDRVIGKDRMPTLDDRDKLPYLEACLREIMRTDTAVPLAIPHRSLTETKLGGYTIPENTSVSVNLVSLHMDEKLWGDPENFRPERFIEDGKLKICLDKTLPFGAGRRLCAGETFARQGMFLCLAMFMQSYHISTVDGKPLKDRAPRIEGLISTRSDLWIRVTPRK